MRVVNFIKDVELIRLGVIKAATASAPVLASRGVTFELWHPGKPFEGKLDGVRELVLRNTRFSYLDALLEDKRLCPSDTVIVSHGPWNFQTRWGHRLQRSGFPWVYVPHGALEPWSMSQKWLKKRIYFRLFEGRMARRSTAIRASSAEEYATLREMFPDNRIELIRNGIAIPEQVPNVKRQRTTVRRFLFLARLNQKKGPVPLIEAWLESSCNNDPTLELVLAGPDEGEGERVANLISRSNNVRYVGPVYGDDKRDLFRESTFYILPSASEGLPTSVLEAVAEGLVPLITDGCNVSELFGQDGAVRITRDVPGIRAGIDEVSNWPPQRIDRHQEGLQCRLRQYFDIRSVADRHFELFEELVRGSDR